MLHPIAEHPHVGDVRQLGYMVGIELCADKATKRAFDPKMRTGAAVCQRARELGVIIRPLGDVIVLMPPPAMQAEDLQTLVSAVAKSLDILC